MSIEYSDRVCTTYQLTVNLPRRLAYFLKIPELNEQISNLCRSTGIVPKIPQARKLAREKRDLLWPEQKIESNLVIRQTARARELFIRPQDILSAYVISSRGIRIAMCNSRISKAIPMDLIRIRLGS